MKKEDRKKIKEVCDTLDKVHTQCGCLEIGENGTKDHTIPSHRLFLGFNNRSRVSPCRNHLKNYLSSIHFEEKVEQL